MSFLVKIEFPVPLHINLVFDVAFMVSLVPMFE